jgi:DNA-binding response OmpR family regulator
MTGMLGRKILVVDDEPTTRLLIQKILDKAGYRVFTAQDGQEGLRQFFDIRPDLAILDVMMPNLNGWQMLQSIRQMSDIPVLMLTSKNCDADIAEGLDRGADDYLTKPFSAAVLLSRINAILRRVALTPAARKLPYYADDYLSIDLFEHRVLVNGLPVKLSAKEYGILAYMVENAGRLLTTSQILENVWGYEYRDESDYVRVYMTHLRQKLEPDPKNCKYIETEHGTGYRFIKQTD